MLIHRPYKYSCCHSHDIFYIKNYMDFYFSNKAGVSWMTQSKAAHFLMFYVKM